MSATLTQLRRATCKALGSIIDDSRRLSKGSRNIVRGQFPCSRQNACQTSFDTITSTHQCLYILLHNWLSVFHHEYRLVFGSKLLDSLNRQRILTDLQDIATVAQCLFDIVVGNATCDDTCVATILLYSVEGRSSSFGFHSRLLVEQGRIFLSGDTREQYPLIGRWHHLVLLPCFASLDSRTTVSQSGNYTKQYRLLQSFTELEGFRHHVIGFLLI